jgi:O-antigen/teichoic acid export membrane protein
MTSACGLVAGLLLAFGLPVVDVLLFAGEVEVPLAVSVPVGASLALYAATSSIAFTVLAPSGRTGRLLAATVVGAVTAVAGMAVLAPALGAAGGALAVAVAQVAVLVVQVWSGGSPVRVVPFRKLQRISSATCHSEQYMPPAHLAGAGRGNGESRWT